MYVFKSDTKSLDVFSAAKPGQLGTIYGDKAHFFHPLATQMSVPIHLQASFEVPSVEVFFCRSLFLVDAVDDSIKRGVKACVFIAFGDGYWAAGRADITILLAKHRIPSVIVSQANGCFINESNAGFGIPGGWLRVAGARAPLILCLIKEMDHGEIERQVRTRSRQGDPGAIK